MSESLSRLSVEDLQAECGTQLPDKEVMSLLDLNVDVDIALDLAAPIDLAIAANANIAAAVDASVSANVLSFDSVSQAMAKQQTMIDQYISGEAIADAPQVASIDQSNDIVDAGTGTAGTAGAVDTAADVTAEPVTSASTTDVANSTVSAADAVNTGSIFDDGLLNVNVDIDLDADMAAPIAGAVAANANVAAPIDAAVSANVLSFNSASTAIADQTAVINQSLDGVVAHATAAQDADITQ